MCIIAPFLVASLPIADLIANLDVDHSFCARLPDGLHDPIELLKTCEAAIIKTYLEDRVQRARIKKESTIKSYWRRLGCKYIDVAGRGLDNGTELDVRDVREAHPQLYEGLPEILG